MKRRFLVSSPKRKEPFVVFADSEQEAMKIVWDFSAVLFYDPMCGPFSVQEMEPVDDL